MSDLPKRIGVASQERLGEVEHLADRFFREVLDLDYAEYLVSDESDLRDFADIFGQRDELVERMLDRLERHYLSDARVLGSTRIV